MWDWVATQKFLAQSNYLKIEKCVALFLSDVYIDQIYVEDQDKDTCKIFNYAAVLTFFKYIEINYLIFAVDLCVGGGSVLQQSI